MLYKCLFVNTPVGISNCFVCFQSLHAVDVSTYIQFLPTILNILFKLVANTQTEEISMNAVR